MNDTQREIGGAAGFNCGFPFLIEKYIGSLTWTGSVEGLWWRERWYGWCAGNGL